MTKQIESNQLNPKLRAILSFDNKHQYILSFWGKGVLWFLSLMCGAMHTRSSNTGSNPGAFKVVFIKTHFEHFFQTRDPATTSKPIDNRLLSKNFVFSYEMIGFYRKVCLGKQKGWKPIKPVRCLSESAVDEEINNVSTLNSINPVRTCKPWNRESQSHREKLAEHI